MSTPEPNASKSVVAKGKLITADSAKARYDALGLGGWERDSQWGMFFALDVAIEHEMLRRLQRHQRLMRGQRAQRDEPLAPWVRPALEELLPPMLGALAVRDDPRMGGFAGAMRQPACIAIVTDLVLNDSVTALTTDLHPDLRAEAELTLYARLEAWLATFPPRGMMESEAFYRGVRLFWRANGRPEPTTEELALLAIARGLENEQERSKAIKHWGERRRRWSSKMDAEFPAWRAAADQAREAGNRHRTS